MRLSGYKIYGQSMHMSMYNTTARDISYAAPYSRFAWSYIAQS